MSNLVFIPSLVLATSSVWAGGRVSGGIYTLHDGMPLKNSGFTGISLENKPPGIPIYRKKKFIPVLTLYKLVKPFGTPSG